MNITVPIFMLDCGDMAIVNIVLYSSLLNVFFRGHSENVLYVFFSIYI